LNPDFYDFINKPGFLLPINVEKRAGLKPSGKRRRKKNPPKSKIRQPRLIFTKKLKRGLEMPALFIVSM
jgi:hypothetical protein